MTTDNRAHVNTAYFAYSDELEVYFLSHPNASDNRFTVRALAYIIPGHFAHHVSVLRERYL